MCAVHASRGRLEPAGRSCAPRSRSSAGSPRRALGDRHGIAWDGVRRRLRPDPRPHRAGRARAVDDYDDEVAAARRLRAAAPPAGLAGRSHTATGKARVHRQPARSARGAAGPAAAADAAQPRPVQHHDLRPRRPLPRHPRRPAGGVRQRGRPRRARLADGDLVDLVSEWTDGVDRRADGVPVVGVPRRRGAAPRPTSRRPTSWSPSTARPSRATPRRRRPSWSAWFPAPDAAAAIVPACVSWWSGEASRGWPQGLC